MSIRSFLSWLAACTMLALLAVVSGCATVSSPFGADHPLDYSEKTAIGTNLTYNYDNPKDEKYFMAHYESACQAGAHRPNARICKEIRNRIMHELIGVVDDNFHQYARSLRGSRAGKDLLTKVSSLILTGVGTFTTQGTTQILSAADTILKGTSETIDTAYFHDLTSEALINQMQANRAERLVKIYENMDKNDSAYPLQAGIADINRYHGQGSVTMALMTLVGKTAESARDAKNEAHEAKLKISD